MYRYIYIDRYIDTIYLYVYCMMYCILCIYIYIYKVVISDLQHTEWSNLTEAKWA